jgi:hypothetical protein
VQTAAVFHFPTRAELRKTYDRFLRRERLNERFFASTSQWVRVDPRLGEIWCENFVKDFDRLDPRGFRAELARVAFPQVVGVLIEQVIRYYGLPRERRAEVKNFLRFVMDGIPRVPYQDFFIGVSPLGAKSVREVSESPSIPFVRYGFYERTIFRNKGSVQVSTDLGRKVRRRILEGFLDRQTGRFTVEDYLHALPAEASRRVAQLDLAASPRVRAYGKTRGRFYRVKN